ncbi:MAG: helix-turn-helix domain-containing protein [Candidatus Aminicenantia bacterium]
MSTLGKELKREREFRAISLEEIARTTKINLKFLKAIEDDHFEILPGGFFTKNFLRAYANYVGLDENEVLNKYLQQVKPKEEYSVSGSYQIIKRELSKSQRIFWARIGVIILSIVLLYLFFNLLIIPHLSKPTTQPPSYVKVTLPPSPTPPLIPPEKEKLVLEMSFIEDTWIQVYSDGELKLDGIMKEGQMEKIEATEEIVINTGNAGGISFRLNGKEGKSLGSSGKVIKNIKINLNNFEQFVENTNSDST